MFKNEAEKYQSLNELATPNGVVILGGTSDTKIPLCELKQAFDLSTNLYNRSVENLSITYAIEHYNNCIKTLAPETILLHIGEADFDYFNENPSDFDQMYRELISTIKSSNSKCNIVIISLKNINDDVTIAELNKHLKYIAESERCEFGDISSKRVWNPKQTKDVISFVYSTGFVRPLRIKRPIYDLVKILFCFEPSYLS